jgi:hypothetical protein
VGVENACHLGVCAEEDRVSARAWRLVAGFAGGRPWDAFRLEGLKLKLQSKEQMTVGGLGKDPAGTGIAEQRAELSLRDGGIGTAQVVN